MKWGIEAKSSKGVLFCLPQGQVKNSDNDKSKSSKIKINDLKESKGNCTQAQKKQDSKESKESKAQKNQSQYTRSPFNLVLNNFLTPLPQ